MKKILIIQSCAPNAPEWVRECMHSVELWCEIKGYDYMAVGDCIFNMIPISTLKFPRVTQSDLARLKWMWAELADGSRRAVYWLDADFLIWDIYRFTLPIPQPGSVVCAFEAYHVTKGDTRLNTNNAVLGLCEANDVELLIEHSQRILKESRGVPKVTIIGTDFFSGSRFPLRRVRARCAGCFSEATIDQITGPWWSGRHHVWELSLAHGENLSGANLCSSLGRNNSQMMALIRNMINGYDLELGAWRHISPAWRLWLRVSKFFRCIRCWLQSRIREIRKTLIPSP